VKHINTLSKVSQTGPGANRINEAYVDAIQSIVQKAVIVGQLLIEQRDAMMTCHRGKSSEWNDKNKPDNDQFGKWLSTNCPAIPQRTAYRWMELADRVSRVIRGIGVGLPTSQCIDIEGVEMPLSQALTAPVEDLPEQAREYRQAMFDFVDGKTMKDCLAAVLVEGDEVHRVSRAGNGKAKGGTRGEDRKDYATFAARKIAHLTTFLEANLDQVQQAKIIASFDAGIQVWPRWLLTAIAKSAASELKRPEADRAQGKGEQ
jgi:hypothetical protein